MNHLIVKDYKPILNTIETEKAIKFVRDNFEKILCKKLNLIRVSAPLFVNPSSGLNDNLNGYEKTVSFNIKGVKEEAEIVQSLAKWKRYALGKYGFNMYDGIYTNMNAIRKDEDLDALHSAYVDQWDWEKIIDYKDRNRNYLKKIVKEIYKTILKLASMVESEYHIKHDLPKDIYFITTKELEAMYPNNTPKERENLICKEKKAVFLMQIGLKLKNRLPHDGRAADYDDWKLNGDILLYNEVTKAAFELSSMGIRVDEVSLVNQLKAKNELNKLDNPYCKDILNKKLPYTIGGGIGQSRLCMFMLKKAHIGEVQASIWPEGVKEELESHNIYLL